MSHQSRALYVVLTVLIIGVFYIAGPFSAQETPIKRMSNADARLYRWIEVMSPPGRSSRLEHHYDRHDSKPLRDQSKPYLAIKPYPLGQPDAKSPEIIEARKRLKEPKPQIAAPIIPTKVKVTMVEDIPDSFSEDVVSKSKNAGAAVQPPGQAEVPSVAGQSPGTGSFPVTDDNEGQGQPLFVDQEPPVVPARIDDYSAPMTRLKVAVAPPEPTGVDGAESEEELDEGVWGASEENEEEDEIVTTQSEESGEIEETDNEAAIEDRSAPLQLVDTSKPLVKDPPAAKANPIAAGMVPEKQAVTPPRPAGNVESVQLPNAADVPASPAKKANTVKPAVKEAAAAVTKPVAVETPTQAAAIPQPPVAAKPAARVPPPPAVAQKAAGAKLNAQIPAAASKLDTEIPAAAVKPAVQIPAVAKGAAGVNVPPAAAQEAAINVPPVAAQKAAVKPPSLANAAAEPPVDGRFPAKINPPAVAKAPALGGAGAAKEPPAAARPPVANKPPNAAAQAAAIARNRASTDTVVDDHPAALDLGGPGLGPKIDTSEIDPASQNPDAVRNPLAEKIPAKGKIGLQPPTPAQVKGGPLLRDSVDELPTSTGLPWATLDADPAHVQEPQQLPKAKAGPVRKAMAAEFD